VSRLIRTLLSLTLLLGAMGLAACRGEQPAADQPTDQSASEEGDAAPEQPPEEPEAPEAPASSVDTETLVIASIGEPETMDPAWTYETTGSGLQQNIYDPMIYFNREKPDEFVPQLATEWALSEDGTTYTFQIREGVTFHEGGTLEPSDIAYSIQRGLLQDRVDGPQWLLMEPLLGSSSITDLAFERAEINTDVAEGEEGPTLADVPNDVLVEICDEIQVAIAGDNEAGTVTIDVLQPTPWMLQLLAQTWGSALDKEWMAEQGDWDGNCANAEGVATWMEWNAPEAQETVLFDQANGTGPFMLESWKKGESVTLVANEDYWRTEPIWEGGPSGAPAIKRVVMQKVDEWGNRLAKLQAGEADIVNVPRGQIDQVEGMIHTQFEGGDESAPAEMLNPDGTLKLFIGYPLVSMTAAMFTFDINPDSEFIGSGELGDGIPPDFFSDLDVRKAFNYCFDWETFIADALKGEGVQPQGPIISGLQGHDPDSPVYTYDIELCRQFLASAWDGAVAENGFSMTLAYNEGNETRQTAAEILADNLAAVDPRYKIQVQDLEWPSFLEARRVQSLPISVSGWLEDYHDASNWVHPFMHSNGAYARAQGFPTEMQERFDALIDQAVLETDEAIRADLYAQLQQMAYEDAINIFLVQATGRNYMNKAVNGWFYNPLRSGDWYYPINKEG